MAEDKDMSIENKSEQAKRVAPGWLRKTFGPLAGGAVLFGALKSKNVAESSTQPAEDQTKTQAKKTGFREFGDAFELPAEDKLGDAFEIPHKPSPEPQTGPEQEETGRKPLSLPVLDLVDSDQRELFENSNKQDPNNFATFPFDVITTLDGGLGLVGNFTTETRETVDQALNSEEVLDLYGEVDPETEKFQVRFGVAKNKATFQVEITGQEESGETTRRVIGVSQEGKSGEHIAIFENERDFLIIVDDLIAGILGNANIEVEAGQAVIFGAQPTPDGKGALITSFVDENGQTRPVVEESKVSEVEEKIEGLPEDIQAKIGDIVPTQEAVVLAAAEGSGVTETMSENQADWTWGNLESNLAENQVLVFTESTPEEVRGKLESGVITKINGNILIIGTDISEHPIVDLDVQKWRNLMLASGENVESNTRIEFRSWEKGIDEGDIKLVNINDNIQLVLPIKVTSTENPLIIRKLYLSQKGIEETLRREELAFQGQGTLNRSWTIYTVVLLGIPMDATGDAWTRTDNRQTAAREENMGNLEEIFQDVWRDLYDTEPPTFADLQDWENVPEDIKQKYLVVAQQANQEIYGALNVQNTAPVSAVPKSKTPNLSDARAVFNPAAGPGRRNRRPAKLPRNQI